MGLKQFARLAGFVFLLLGVWGLFVNHLFGLFHLHAVHNVIHLSIGSFGIIASFNELNSRLFARILGIVYVLFGTMGFFSADLLGLMHVELSDNLLHLLVGFIALYFGYVGLESIEVGKTAKSA